MSSRRSPSRSASLVRWVIFLLWTTVATLGGTELVLRMTGTAWQGWYSYPTDLTTPRRLDLPWGTIVINADGWPDDPFDDEKTRPRVGYLGDSVTFGLGAGHGERFTERLDTLQPQIEHLNFGRPGWSGADQGDAERALALVTQYELDLLVWVLNLNDIRGRGSMRTPGWGDWLRQRSALASMVHVALTKRQSARKPSASQPELYPNKRQDIVAKTAARVLALKENVEKRGCAFAVVLLPYEMQISEEAAAHYQSIGIRWEAGFEERSTQLKLQEQLVDTRVYDAYWAFVDRKTPAESRASNALCADFICDRGGELDWNHPTRSGHAKIGEWMVQAGLFRVLEDR